MKKDNLIDKRRLVRTFLDLVRINAPSFEEAVIGRHLDDRLKALGFRVMRQKYDRSFNLIAVKKGGLKGVKPLMLCAHMDTIEPTEGIRYSVKNNIIKSAGSTVLGADDKSAIAQILEAATVLHETKIPHGDVEIVLTSAEEKGLFGARNLDFRKISSRHALVLDSGGPVGRIVVAAPSHITYEMRITGRPAHAGIEPEKGISAVRVAADIIAKVTDGRIDKETTANIGIIRGGTATNVVPREVILNGEVRGHDPLVLKSVKKSIFRTAKTVSREWKAKVHISEQQEYQSFRINEAEPFLLFMDSIFRKCGMKPVHTITGGGSDANIFNQQGIITLNLSTGMQNVHSHDEFIRTEDLYSGARVVLQAVQDFGLSKKA